MLPHKLCMDALGDIGPQIEKNIWPTFNELVCKKNRCPNYKNYPFFEKEVIKPLWKMLGYRGLKLPPYSGDVEKLFDSIAEDCFQKKKTNFCNMKEVQEAKGCAIDKGMGFIMKHLDMGAKYGYKENCEIAIKSLKDPKIWAWGRTIVKKFAKEVKPNQCK
jgi:hypothetical protein